MKSIFCKYLIITALILVLPSCGDDEVKYYNYKLEEVLPHDRGAYTQGLFFDGDRLFESTGQYGESSLREVDLKSGEVLRQIDLDSTYFAEGSCNIGDDIFLLTWMERKLFVYNKSDFSLKYTFPLNREGWGVTTDGKKLYMSDGSANLYVVDPKTITDEKVLRVTLNGKPVPYINELEWIEGDIWANVYGDNAIVIINPNNGKVKGVIDCSSMLPNNLRSSETDVLNGIAYHNETKLIYVTGKLWPRLYRISLIERK